MSIETPPLQPDEPKEENEEEKSLEDLTESYKKVLTEIKERGIIEKLKEVKEEKELPVADRLILKRWRNLKAAIRLKKGMGKTTEALKSLGETLKEGIERKGSGEKE